MEPHSRDEGVTVHEKDVTNEGRSRDEVAVGS